MGRYSLNLRSKYGEREPVGTEQLQAGIGGALDDVLRAHEQSRQEANTMAAAGGTRLPDDPANSVMGRLRGIGASIQGALGRGPQAPAPVIPSQGETNASIASGVAMPRAPAMNVAAPGLTPSYPAERPTTQGRAARPSIGAAIQPYVYEGATGARYSVDPLHGARVAEAGKSLGEDDKIQALIDAGMPAAEARARVLNNVVRYDETFGQQTRGRAGGVSQKDWESRENLRQQHRKEIEAMHASGRMTSTQLQQERLRLQTEELEDRRAQAKERAERGDVAGDVSIATALGKTISTDPIALATETDAQKQARLRKETLRDTRIGAAAKGQDRLKNAHAPREAIAARAAAIARANPTLDEAGIRAQMASEGYPSTARSRR